MSGTVGYLTKRFPRLSETFILDEILGLEAAGVPLRVYALAHPGEALTQPDVDRVASPVTYIHPRGPWRVRLAAARAAAAAHGVLLWRSPGRYLWVLAYIARKRRHRSTVRHFVEAGRLARHLEQAKARHVHAAFAHGPASVAHFVHLLTGMPFSFGAHAKDLYLSAPDLLARKVAAAEFVLACSDSAATRLRQIAGPNAYKVILAHHGVDTARFAPAPLAPGPPPTQLRILSVGRLVDKKGYPVLLRALANLVASGHSVSCSIVGTGPRRSDLEALVAQLGLSATVEFLGARTHQEVAACYREADVFVQASVVLPDGDRDGTPNSLLEAMACGLPVAASSVAGIPEAVPEGCGLLFPQADHLALAAALKRLDVDPQLRKSLGIAARAHVVARLDRLACARSLAPLFGSPSMTTSPAQILEPLR